MDAIHVPMPQPLDSWWQFYYYRRKKLALTFENKGEETKISPYIQHNLL